MQPLPLQTPTISKQKMTTEEHHHLIQAITSLYTLISDLPSLHPSPESNHLFSKLVALCIAPSSINISTIPQESQDMRAHLIFLCSRAEGLLEAHYSTIISVQNEPLNSLDMFPYYDNYERLTEIEFGLLLKHITSSIMEVAFVGSGPLPLSTLVLAGKYLTDAVFVNYDLDPNATAMGRKLVEGNPGLAERVLFQTSDVMDVKRAFNRYDVVFLAALVGMEQEAKRKIIEHLSKHMKSNALLVVRSAHTSRAFLYPVVDMEDMVGFDVLSVHHPSDEVVNSVIVARKKGINVMSCKCCEPLVSNLGYGSLAEELAVEGHE